MDQETYDKGMGVRRAMFGDAYVEASAKNVDPFFKPLQELVIEYCWGAVWAREGLPRKTRSMINIAMIAALNRPNELRLHVKGALANGVTPEEIQEILLQAAIYAGVPAAADAFGVAREVIADAKK